MKSFLFLPILFLFSCKTAEINNSYAVTICDTIYFSPQHLHVKYENVWHCYEFPADTLEVDRVVYESITK